MNTIKRTSKFIMLKLLIYLRFKVSLIKALIFKNYDNPKAFESVSYRKYVFFLYVVALFYFLINAFNKAFFIIISKEECSSFPMVQFCKVEDYKGDNNFFLFRF